MLHRTYTLLENFSTTFGLCVSRCLCLLSWLTRVAALYFVGGVRVTFSTGIAAGGNLAYWLAVSAVPVFRRVVWLTLSICCLPPPGQVSW